MATEGPPPLKSPLQQSSIVWVRATQRLTLVDTRLPVSTRHDSADLRPHSRKIERIAPIDPILGPTDAKPVSVTRAAE